MQLCGAVLLFDPMASPEFYHLFDATTSEHSFRSSA